MNDTSPPTAPQNPETKRAMRQRLAQIALAVVMGLSLAGALAFWQIYQDQSRIENLRVIANDKQLQVDLGGPFALTDQNGKPVTDATYRGKFMLVYFGFTYCPDMCPTGLQDVAHVMDDLGPDAAKVQPLFITIDPERDTVAKIKEYATSFHPTIVGLTGTAQQIADVAKAYKVYYAKAEKVDDKNYMMDHSTLFYLMGPDGKFITTFNEDVETDDIVARIKEEIGKIK